MEIFVDYDSYIMHLESLVQAKSKVSKHAELEGFPN